MPILSLGDWIDAFKWVVAHLWIVVIVVIAGLTSNYWFPTVVRFFTETKLGQLLAAAFLTLGGGYLLLKKDREAQYQRGRADAEREWRLKNQPSSKVKAAKKQEWWLGKR
jgi:hypothetical protein